MPQLESQIQFNSVRLVKFQRSPRMRLAKCKSLDEMVTLLAWVVHK